MKATIFDGISRDLGEGATRRGFLRLLGGVATVAAAAAIGAGGPGEIAAAKRRGRKRGKRHTPNTQQPEQSQDPQYELYPVDGQTMAASSIPPNCIFVCCDGTCDSWKMCLKCVKWPKGTTAGTVAVR